MKDMSDTEAPKLPGKAGTVLHFPQGFLVIVKRGNLEIPLLESQFSRHHVRSQFMKKL